MAQNFPEIAATDLVSASRVNILARDDALKSNFAGTTYPTSGLIAGQVCFRTDLKKAYFLEQASPAIWREIVFASNLGTAASAAIGTSGDTVPKNNTANIWSALQTFASGFNFGSQTLTGNSGSIKADTDLRLNALVEKNINFLVNSASKMIINSDGGITVGAASGGSKGDGSINAVLLYQNGTPLGTAATKNTGVGTGKIPLYESFGDLAFLDSIDHTNMDPSGVSAGSYTNPNLTINAAGLITSATPGTDASSPLSAQDITASAYIDFEDIFEAGYNYKIALTYARPASAASLYIQFLTSGGVITDNYQHASSGIATDGITTNQYSVGDTELRITPSNILGSPLGNINSLINIFDPVNTPFPAIAANGGYYSSSSKWVTFQSSGIRQASSITATGFRLYFGGTSFYARGKVSVWKEKITA